MSAPLLTVIVPAYNSEDYLDRALTTLVGYGDELEAIIVNDGSKDRTAEIADSYAEKYPTIVKAIHKENGKERPGSIVSKEPVIKPFLQP